jgi:hypothetical protein
MEETRNDDDDDDDDDDDESPRYPLDKRLGGPQSQSVQHGKEKILDPNGTQTPIPRSSST